MNLKSLTLSGLQKNIADVLKVTFKEPIWVTAEVAEISNSSNGHTYLELVEKDKNSEKLKARAKAIIWSSRGRMLLPYFESVTGSPLRDGFKILIKVTVEYHEVYGLSMVITDIEPSFTLGEMEMQRQQIINMLKSEGVFDMNREHEFPSFPRNIAVISSGKAAGFQDFTDHLQANSHGYKFNIRLYEAIMQGSETVNSVTGALNRIYDDLDKTDIVVIVRGGGSQVDLSWFDNYDIAYLVSQFPVPVISGIGHEKDESITDMVSYINLKTPTAVADYIISVTWNSEETLINMGRSIIDTTLIRVDSASKKLMDVKLRIGPVVISDLGNKRSTINQLYSRIEGSLPVILQKGKLRLEFLSKSLKTDSHSLISKMYDETKFKTSELQSVSKRSIRVNTEKISHIARSVEYMRPESVLKRGYSITLSGGKIVKDYSKIRKGEMITTKLAYGELESKVFDIKK